MIICSNCNTEITATTKFCKNCGAKIVVPTPQPQATQHVTPPPIHTRAKSDNVKWYIIGGVVLLLGLGFLFKDKILAYEESTVASQTTTEVPEAVPAEAAPSWSAEGNIRAMANAQDNRDFDQLWGYYSPDMTRYWDMNNPTYGKLKKRYTSVWNKLSYSTNEITSVEHVSGNTYDMNTTFTYQMKKSGKTKTGYSTVRYKFDDYGRVVEVYGL